MVCTHTHTNRGANTGVRKRDRVRERKGERRLLLLPISAFGSTKATRACLVPAGCVPCLWLFPFRSHLTRTALAPFLPHFPLSSLLLSLSTCTARGNKGEQKYFPLIVVAKVCSVCVLVSVCACLRVFVCVYVCELLFMVYLFCLSPDSLSKTEARVVPELN